MDGIRNAHITLYHHTWDAAQRRDVWTHTQYRGVSWYGGLGISDSGGRSASSGAGSDTAADGYIVRIYGSAEVAVLPGDIVVKGLVTDEITAASELTQKYAESWRVTGVRDNRRGGRPHWRIEGA